jgi:type I restriction enzyme S subunit
LPLLRGNNIQDGAVHEGGLINVDGRCVSDHQILRSGDIVLTMSSGSAGLIGKSAWIGSLSCGMTFGAFCACLRANERALSRLVFWFLQTPFYRGRITNSAKGTNINNLKREHLELLPVPLAPLAEQRRIVARVDALFAEIAEGEAALAEARKGLDIFRRALLKAAVTGELTKDWRAVNPVSKTGRDLLASTRNHS